MTLSRLIFLFSLLGCQLALSQTTSPRGGNNYDGKSMETTSDVVPEEIKNVGITEKIGDSINLNLLVTDETGKTAPISHFFENRKAVLLSPIYYACPGLCSFHFNGVIESLKKVDWNPGDKFSVLAFSFDAKENSELGAKKKQNYMKMYGRPEAEAGFHFLTADQKTIDELMNSVGFKYKWNEKAGEWSHASAAIMISPDGKISRYLHGVEFDPKDMKLALNEAAQGKIGSLIDYAVMYCFKYDQHQSKYGLQVFRVVQLAGFVTILFLAVWLLPVLYKSGREKV